MALEHQVYFVEEEKLVAALDQLAANGWDLVAAWPRRTARRWGFWMQRPAGMSLLVRRPRRSWPIPDETEAE